MKTIFIYGFTGSERFKNARKFFDNLYCFEYNSKLTQPIENIAEELNSFIRSKTKTNEKVNLIGISAGGIISDYYAKFINSKKVNKIATICSPFGGTYLSFFFPKKFKGLKELSYNSGFLKKLKTKKLGKNKTINFYSFFDLLVPFNSGKGENTKYTWNFFHFTVQHDKRILKKIKNFFEK